MRPCRIPIVKIHNLYEHEWLKFMQTNLPLLLKEAADASLSKVVSGEGVVADFSQETHDNLTKFLQLEDDITMSMHANVSAVFEKDVDIVQAFTLGMSADGGTEKTLQANIKLILGAFAAANMEKQVSSETPTFELDQTAHGTLTKYLEAEDDITATVHADIIVAAGIEKTLGAGIWLEIYETSAGNMEKYSRADTKLILGTFSNASLVKQVTTENLVIKLDQTAKGSVEKYSKLDTGLYVNATADAGTAKIVDIEEVFTVCQQTAVNIEKYTQTLVKLIMDTTASAHFEKQVNAQNSAVKFNQTAHGSFEKFLEAHKNVNLLIRANMSVGPVVEKEIGLAERFLLDTSAIESFEKYAQAAVKLIMGATAAACFLKQLSVENSTLELNQTAHSSIIKSLEINDNMNLSVYADAGFDKVIGVREIFEILSQSGGALEKYAQTAINSIMEISAAAYFVKNLSSENSTLMLNQTAHSSIIKLFEINDGVNLSVCADAGTGKFINIEEIFEAFANADGSLQKHARAALKSVMSAFAAACLLKDVGAKNPVIELNNAVKDALTKFADAQSTINTSINADAKSKKFVNARDDIKLNISIDDTTSIKSGGAKLEPINFRNTAGNLLSKRASATENSLGFSMSAGVEMSRPAYFDDLDGVTLDELDDLKLIEIERVVT